MSWSPLLSRVGSRGWTAWGHVLFVRFEGISRSSLSRRNQIRQIQKRKNRGPSQRWRGRSRPCSGRRRGCWCGRDHRGWSRAHNLISSDTALGPGDSSITADDDQPFIAGGPNRLGVGHCINRIQVAFNLWQACRRVPFQRISPPGNRKKLSRRSEGIWRD